MNPQKIVKLFCRLMLMINICFIQFIAKAYIDINVVNNTNQRHLIYLGTCGTENARKGECYNTGEDNRPNVDPARQEYLNPNQSHTFRMSYPYTMWSVNTLGIDGQYYALSPDISKNDTIKISSQSPNTYTLEYNCTNAGCFQTSQLSQGQVCSQIRMPRLGW